MIPEPNLPGWSLRELIPLTLEHSPHLRPLCCPKRLQVPGGYPDPESLIASAYAANASALRGVTPVQDVTITSTRVACALLIKYQVPTYFVSTELCEALLETEAPEDLRFSEIIWPMPAMLFLLPFDFTQRYFRMPVHWLAALHIPAHALIHNPVIIDGIQSPTPIEVWNGDPIFLANMLAWENGWPVHYDSRCPVNGHQVKDLLDEGIQHYSMLHHVGPEEKKQDNLTVKRLATITINILLAMTAEPELITRERIIKPAKKKNGRILRHALWKPNFIGEHFRISYEKHAPEGSHRSPHAHWRRGHWRNQRHGPQNTLVKRIWLKPVYVGLTTVEA